LAGLAEAGSKVGITDHLTRLAQAQALDGKIDDAVITIEEALQANLEELVFRPNALTCRGDLRLILGQTELAEADFREAIALAHKMQAKAWELRATHEPYAAAREAEPSRRSAHDTHPDLQLVHRRLRHR
jgi:tetratricopeptide (TPR) repeat protein